MLYNQNGYPEKACSKCEAVAECNSMPEGDTDNGDMTYAEASERLIGAPLAYVYSPNQRFRLLYSAPEALKHGTLFEELYKPMEVYGNE